MKHEHFLSTALLLLAATISSFAGYVTGTGTIGGSSVVWEARRNIVTTIDPAALNYNAVHGTPFVGYSGVGGLIVNTPTGAGICTGSLINARQIVTAAHCLTDENGNPLVTSVDAVFFGETADFVSSTSSYVIHPNYTGSVFDDHDIAVITLGEDAPSDVERLLLYNGPITQGNPFEVVGFGQRGQGNTGATIPSGLRRRGFNEFDTLGGSLLPFLGVTNANSVLMFDFDNGLAANDAFGFWLGLTGLGLGEFESGTAPGDSGGPSFIDGQIAAVTSFGLTFTATDPDTGQVFNSDVLPGLNASFGEFGGNTSVAFNRAWIDSVLIPEPSTWLMMISGFGLVALGRRLCAVK